MPIVEKEIKKTVNKTTKSKSTKGKKGKGTSPEKTVRKAAKKLT
jgi:hypothetical protein